MNLVKFVIFLLVCLTSINPKKFFFKFFRHLDTVDKVKLYKFSEIWIQSPYPDYIFFIKSGYAPYPLEYHLNIATF